MEEIISFLQAHWTEWLFTAALAVLSWAFRGVRAQLKEERERNEYIAAGVQALLRESIVNGYNRARYVRDTTTLIGSSHYKYLSVICADERARGVSIEGCKYPLKNTTLNRRFQFAVSNEIIKNCALISVRRGGIFIIESND